MPQFAISVMSGTSYPPNPTALSRLADMFRGAMGQLGVKPESADLERWAVVIHSSMSGRGRSYHTVDHVFQVNGDNDAIGTLAILFHDTVYCEVDGGLPRALVPVLGDALYVKGDHVELGEFDPSRGVLRALVTRIFGFEPGQRVTFRSGLNELASALLAARTLRSHLDLRTLAEVVTCIEATIPFRDQNAEELLAARLAEADREHSLGLGAEGVERAVSRAVEVANRDVANFAYEDPASFLSHTWEILPETNPTLRAPAYTLGEYRLAMSKMQGFLGSLEATRVFRVFRDTPNGPDLASLHRRATTNLQRGVRYLRQKVLAARLLESLAQLTGGDAPVSLFMGDLPADSRSRRLEDMLSDAPELAEDVDPSVYRLLLEGREKESGFDLRHSPLASRLYAHLGDARSDEVLAQEDGWALLEALPQAIVVSVTRATASLATTREQKLLKIASRLAQSDDA